VGKKNYIKAEKLCIGEYIKKWVDKPGTGVILATQEAEI
jgi:hypothetical protein